MDTEKTIEQLRDERMKAAGRKLIDPTMAYLKLLNQSRNYLIESVFPSINGVVANAGKEDSQFIYESEPLNLCSNFHQLRIADYGFKHEFVLRSDRFTLKVPQLSSRVHSQHFGRTMATKGRLTNFKVNFSDAQKFHRCVFSKPFHESVAFGELIATQEMNLDDKVFCASGLLSVTVGQYAVDIVDYYNEKTRYVFIDCKEPVTLSIFEKIVEAVTTSYGFISGFFLRGEMFCLQSSDVDFSTIEGCIFKELEPTINTGLALFDPRTVAELQNDKKLGRYSMLKPAIFSTIITKAFENERMLRAMKIIAEGNAYSNEIRASVYSVALETVRNVIIEQNEDKVAPIKDKTFAKKLKEDFKKLIDEGDDEQFTNREALYKRINDFNQLPNKDSFKAAFSIVGFELTTEDIKCLESRNVFLHGKLPVDNAKDIESEIKYFTHKLHFLVCALILKYCGYYGWVVNSHKYLEFFDPDYKNSKDEATFRTI